MTAAEYGAGHAAVYDIIWRSRGKDFAAEAAALTDLIRSRAPWADSLLDVACGTGAHLREFSTRFRHVEGVEPAAAMRDIAIRDGGGRVVHDADMRSFDLGRAFDAVICIGNSVACLDSTDDLTAAVSRMAAHLAPGGVLVVEPWFFSANFLDGRVDGTIHKEPGRVVAQLTRFTRDAHRIRMEARFQIVDDAGFRQFDEALSARAFTRQEYVDAFAAAGLRPAFLRGFTVEGGRPTAPGLFVAVRTPAPHDAERAAGSGVR